MVRRGQAQAAVWDGSRLTGVHAVKHALTRALQPPSTRNRVLQPGREQSRWPLAQARHRAIWSENSVSVWTPFVPLCGPVQTAVAVSLRTVPGNLGSSRAGTTPGAKSQRQEDGGSNRSRGASGCSRAAIRPRGRQPGGQSRPVRAQEAHDRSDALPETPQGPSAAADCSAAPRTGQDVPSPPSSAAQSGVSRRCSSLPPMDGSIWSRDVVDPSPAPSN